MNSKNSKTYDPHKLLLDLADQIDLRRKQKYITLSILRIYHKWKNINRSYKNKAPTWIEELQLTDWSYSISDIQDYFKYISKKWDSYW